VTVSSVSHGPNLVRKAAFVRWMSYSRALLSLKRGNKTEDNDPSRLELDLIVNNLWPFAALEANDVTVDDDYPLDSPKGCSIGL
jgi:hypothetical protein